VSKVLQGMLSMKRNDLLFTEDVTKLLKKFFKYMVEQLEKLFQRSIWFIRSISN